MTPAEIRESIAHLEELRSSGVSAAQSDGVNQTYRSMEELNAEIRRLKNELRRATHCRRRHPYARKTF